MHSGRVNQAIAEKGEALSARTIDRDQTNACEVPGHLSEKSGGGIAGSNHQRAPSEIAKVGIGMSRYSEGIVGPVRRRGVFHGIAAR